VPARAQFRDTVLLRASDGTLDVGAGSALVTLYDVDTTMPIAEPIYVDQSGLETLPNPFASGLDGSITFWTAEEREIDLHVQCPGFSTLVVTITTDAAIGFLTGPQGPEGPAGPPGTPGASGSDHDLRVYVQHVMSVLDPTGPPPPPP